MAPDDLADVVPRRPKDLTASSVADGVQLSWSHFSRTNTGSNLDEGAVYEHEISRRRGSNNWEVIGGTARRQSYTDKNVYAGNRYTYRVRARNIHGWGNTATVAHTYDPPTPIPAQEPEEPDPEPEEPDPEPDPCADNTCPANPCVGDGCSDLNRDCGCNCDCYCDELPALAHEFEEHPLLHELMMKRYKTQVRIWSHPYYGLTEFK